MSFFLSLHSAMLIRENIIPQERYNFNLFFRKFKISKGATMYFDTHAHYNDRRFDADRQELLGSLPARGISLVVNPGSSMDTSRRAVELADAFSYICAAVGVHPHDSRTMDDKSIETLERLAAHPKVVAIGEIGLDYHYDHSPREVQRARFREQMELARRLALPVIIHEREATADMLEIVSAYPDVTGVFHCFAGSVETAKRLLAWGWYLSFTGVITYKNARVSHEVISAMPRDRIMIETDAPYLTPIPYRGQRNSSLYLPYVAQTVADLLGISLQEAAALTAENGKQCFGIE